MTKRIVLLAATGALLLAAATAAQDDDDAGAIPDDYVRPVYPDGVHANASCGAWFDVKPDGGVDMLSLTVSCTNPLFVASVEDAMKQWRFAPTIVDGAPVGATGYSARIMFTGGDCARVISGNDIDTPCATAEE